MRPPSDDHKSEHPLKDRVYAIPVYVYLIAFLLRLVAAWTNLRPFHPDEHYQTLEFSNFFVNGAYFTATETYVHLRNLLWPAFLAVPQFLGDLLAKSNLGWSMAPIAFPRILMSCLDTTILFGWLRLGKNFDPMLKNLSICAYLFMWCFIDDSLRPSIEHAAAISFWLAIIDLTPRKGLEISSSAFYRAGLFAAFTGVFKFPAGLLGLGIIAALILRTAVCPNLKINRRNWWFFISGSLTALMLGGLIDTMIYGRPYESLWIYVQFNVFTGLAEQMFGRQNSVEYLSFFMDRFAWEMLPVGLWLAIFALYGIIKGLRVFEPWAFGLLFYFVGHLFPAHKEGRFMIAVFPTVFWAAIFGTQYALPFLRAKYSRWKIHVPGIFNFRNPIANIFKILAFIHCLQILANLRGELWKPRIDFFAARSIAEQINACAVLSVHQPLSYELPVPSYGNLASEAQILRFGKLDIEKDWSSRGLNIDSPIIPFGGWMGLAPICTINTPVVIHTRNIDPIWDSLGCKTSNNSTSNLNALYLAIGQLFLKEMNPGKIYICNQKIIDNLLNSGNPNNIRYTTATGFPHLSHFPPYGLNSFQFIEFINSQFGSEVLRLR